MADLSITELKLGSNVDIDTIRAGEALAAFEVVYKNSNGMYYKTNANHVVTVVATHIVLHTADASGYVAALPWDSQDLTITLVGPTLSVATQYVVSATAGKIAPQSDLTSGYFLTQLFVGATTSTGKVDLGVTGVVIP